MERDKLIEYRKKPVIIQAMQLPPVDTEPELQLVNFLASSDRPITSERDGTLSIHTLEGVMIAEPGDWIIKGVKGEFYPCKPDIFELTYEPVNSLTAPVPDDKVYKRDDLISFGKYLLSKERRDLIKFHPELEDRNFLQRYSSVSDADIANWKDNELFKNP